MMERKLQFDFLATQRVIQKIGQIDQFKGEWKLLAKDENRYLKELRKIATIQSIGSSTRIEGSSLTDAEIASLIKNMKVSKLESRDEQEVVGYFETLETILDQYETIDLSISNIHGLHKLLLKYSSKDHRHWGKYKELTNKVVATYPDGTTRVIFNTTEPFLVEKEMTELLEWTNKGFSGDEIHPLIVIAAFVYEFLSIHPYQDGNGRLSRLLTNLLLLKYGYKFVLYVSLENDIENRKKEYYQALMEGQKDRYKDSENMVQWVQFFLNGLSGMIQKLELKLKEYKNIGGYLNGRQKQILNFIRENQPVKTSDIAQKMTDFNLETIKKDLQYLVRELEIDKLGNNRARVYIARKDK
ncbi:MAG: Fic family protein [Phycisphaerae bacterium]|nr:Fic family protein [Saprospiraceae bacterium]